MGGRQAEGSKRCWSRARCSKSGPPRQAACAAHMLTCPSLKQVPFENRPSISSPSARLADNLLLPAAAAPPLADLAPEEHHHLLEARLLRPYAVQISIDFACLGGSPCSNYNTTRLVNTCRLCGLCRSVAGQAFFAGYAHSTQHALSCHASAGGKAQPTCSSIVSKMRRSTARPVGSALRMGIDEANITQF